MRVIKKSGNWKPAIQNGRQVKSYKKQPIVFKLEAQ
jgi:protein TonB